MTPRLITLSKTHFLVITLGLVILGVIYMVALSSPYTIYNVKCARFDMPEYEKQFGFRLGRIRVSTRGGEGYEFTGFSGVQPGGLLARAGVRPGDVVKVHHGISETCGALGAAALGETGYLRLWSGEALGRGEYEEREVLVRLRPE